MNQMDFEETLENSVKDQHISEIKKIAENQKCIDCSAKKPTWASVNLGLLICLDCAGKHRQYTVKYSFVRSVTLDSWSMRQIMFLQLGGNQRAIQAFSKMGVNLQNIDYRSNQVQKYKNELENKVNQAINQKQTKENNMDIQINNTHQIQQVEIQQNQQNNIQEPEIKQQIIQKQTDFKSLFNKDSSNQQKGKIQARKIEQIDFSQLRLESQIPEKKPIQIQNQNEQPIQINPNHYIQSDFPYKSNCKSMSSKLYFQNTQIDSSCTFQPLPNSNKSISSTQYFGEPEPNNAREYQYQEKVHQIVNNAQETFGNVHRKTQQYFSTFVKNWKK